MTFQMTVHSRPGPSLSFELFPPKSAAGLRRLPEVIGPLEALAPEYVSVTYGAGG
ncbi:MAG: methylenetetrahydrofolate reductase, partial [Pseudomonadota bacterium]